jgi:mRNA interferase MazF
VRFARPDKRRPVLVLGRDESLSSWSQIPVVPLSSQVRGLPWEVKLSGKDGMAVDSVLKPEWIRSVERTLIGPRITALPEHRWPEVRDALLLALGLAS